MEKKIIVLLPVLMLSIALFPQRNKYLVGKWELTRITPSVETDSSTATRWLERTITNYWHPEYDRFEEYTSGGEIIKRESSAASYRLQGNKLIRKEPAYTYQYIFSIVNDSLFLYRDLKDDYAEVMEANNVRIKKAGVELLYIKLHQPDEVDELPYFPGGEKIWQLYMKKNLVTPENGEKCTVTIPIIVNKYGELSHNQSGRTHAGLSFGKVSLGTCHQAIRDMISGKSIWEPAFKNGYPVNVEILMPFEFDPEE